MSSPNSGHERDNSPERDSSPEQNRRLAAAARAALAERDRALDGEALSRLRRARAAALEAESRPNRAWLPIGSAVAAALVVALLWPRAQVPQPASEMLALEPWLLEEDVELELIEDVEFYQWLAEG